MRAGKKLVVMTGLVALGATSLLQLGCSKGEIQPADLVETHIVDNRVEVDGAFCTTSPKEQRFPVKILLILDGSGSLQFTDEGAIRVRAVNELLNRYVGNDSVKFHIILFNSFVVDFPDSNAFVQASSLISPYMSAQLQVAEVLTDYQAALARALEIVNADMSAASQSEARNTKYVLLLFSDGQPSPVCCACEDERASKPVPDTSMDCSQGEVQTSEMGSSLCTTTPADLSLGMNLNRVCDGQWEFNICNNLDDLNVAFEGRWDLDNPNLYPDLELEKNYNREHQILEKVDEMVETAEGLDVGAFQFHTIMLWNEALPAGIQAILGTNYCRQSNLMQEMASRGGGEYREARRAEEIDFLQFDFTALKRTNKLRRVFVTNRNLLPTVDQLVIDSDADGVADFREYEIGTDPLLADTDGDGFTDGIEVRYDSYGLDPIDSKKPYTPCLSAGNTPLSPELDPNNNTPGASPSPSDDLGQAMDSDHDGLRDCEEELIGTNPYDADSDHDTIPDGLEVRFGLDPETADAEGDSDFDGVSNIEEVLRNSNPREDDPRLRRTPAFRYDLVATNETLDQRECFDFQARHVLLGTTVGYFRIPLSDPALPQHIDVPGYNTIQVYEVESPSDNPLGQTMVRGTCYRARYVEPDFREPAKGVVTPAISDMTLIDLVDGYTDADDNFFEAVMYGRDCHGIKPPCRVDEDCPGGLGTCVGNRCVDPT